MEASSNNNVSDQDKYENLSGGRSPICPRVSAAWLKDWSRSRSWIRFCCRSPFSHKWWQIRVEHHHGSHCNADGDQCSKLAQPRQPAEVQEQKAPHVVIADQKMPGEAIFRTSRGGSSGCVRDSSYKTIPKSSANPRRIEANPRLTTFNVP